MNNAYRLSDFIVPPGQVPGWPVKACAGLLCVGLLAVALPLGLLALALLIYIWLILRVTVRPNQISGQMPGQYQAQRSALMRSMPLLMDVWFTLTAINRAGSRFF